MRIGITLTYSGAVPGGNMKKRDWNRLMKAAWEEVGNYWLKHYLKKHFTKAGAREYDYEPRQGETGNPHPKGFWRSYTGRKQKRYHHTLPLVLTGQLRRDAPRGARVRATRNGVSVTLPGARGANRIKNFNAAEELTTMSEAEQEMAARIFDRYIERRLRSFNKRTRKKIL